MMQTQETKQETRVHHGRVNSRGGTIDLTKRVLPDEPKAIVRFANIESPKTRLSFNLPVVVTREVPDPNNPEKTIEKRFNDYEYYILLDGYTYDLPVRVIEHINGLVVPIYDNQKDPETGDIRSVRVGEQPRFSLTPVRWNPTGPAISGSISAQSSAKTGKGKDKDTGPAKNKEE